MDRFNTHVISAILNIGQEVKESVVLDPGEMVWYESARAVHGRPRPLHGEYYDNLFIHFSPAEDWYTEHFTVGNTPRNQPINIDDLRGRTG